MWVNMEYGQLLLFSAQKVLSLSLILALGDRGTVWGERCGSLPFFVGA